MAAETPDLSDRALSIFAFAAYHHLISGQPIASVVRRDGSGHRADPDGVAEVERRGLATLSDDEITFTPPGVAVVERVVAAIRGAGGR
ncbi:hypothetical protein [Methylobacterium nonmethylotrophicum]|uniref:Uncharacterized protein n=1 Tax=Methylobacterium nonmethylotrophicum TaxID=1141884 RepID=A0A4Z0NSQ4_9HYPH|nr:hypothetical protein [Methylobacterium nonmethylotrophicum]TGD99067.1 hypothetical protein EU555_14295 [Methylobacterium nonmethylotrophicum]